MSEIRRLTRDEILSVPGMCSPLPESLIAVGLVDEHGVAAACAVFLVLHADPFWIREDKRHSGKLPLRLWEAVRDEIERRNLGPEVFIGMTDTNPGQPTESLIERMCEVAGGEEIKARFFVIPTSQEAYGERAAS